MDAFEQIKSISIAEVLDAMGIRYLRQGPMLHMYDGDRLTNGWKANLNDHIVKDFAGKRAEGDRVTFVMKHLNMSSKAEAVKWYESMFKITSAVAERPQHAPQKPPLQAPKPEKRMNPDIFAKWNALPPMNEAQKAYVRSRGIDPEAVSKYAKDNNGMVCCAVYDESGIITLQSRDVTEKRFMIEKGTNSKGCFMTEVDKSNKKVYVVEGMFDFLTLAQTGENVIGMKSATDGADVVRLFQSKGYEVVIIPDNDEAGRKSHSMFDDMPHFWFDLSHYEVKDVNEFLVKSEWSADQVVLAIDDERTIAGPVPPKKDYEIVDYVTGLEEGLEELTDTKVKDVISWGITSLDQKLGYLMPGQLVLVGGVTGAGKSTFVNEIAGNVSKQGIKVGRFVLEDRHQDKRKDDLYYTVGRIRKGRGQNNYPKSEFMVNNIHSDSFLQELKEAKEMLSANYRNILDIKANTQKQMKIEQLGELVGDFIARGCKLIIIDHLHYFKISGDAQRYDLQIESAMQYINAMARDYNITIMLIAHYKKLGGEKPNDESFKDSMSIAQVPNKVLHVHRDKMATGAITELIVTKNREGYTGTIEMNFDPETHQYSNAKSDLQKTRESKAFSFDK